MGRRGRPGRTGHRLAVRFRYLRARGAHAGPLRATRDSDPDRRRAPTRDAAACAGPSSADVSSNERARDARPRPKQQQPSIAINESRRFFAPTIEKIAKTARRTDSLQKERVTMSAPNEKKSDTDNARGEHVNGSAGRRREPLLTSTPGIFKGDADLREPRYRLLNDADNVPEPSLHARKPTRGSMLVGTISFSTVAAILFLVWGGIEIMPASERIPIPSNPAASLDPAISTGLAPAGTSRPMTSILIGIQDRQALVNEPIPLGGMLFGAGEEAIHITGLTEGSRLSAGEKLGSSGWQIPPRELAGVVVVPPASFIGTMRTVIQLRSSGNVPVDTQVASYEWVAKLTDREAPPRPQPKAND